MQKWLTIGFFFINFSNGDSNPSVAWGRLLITWAVIFMHSAQNRGRAFLACNMLLHIFVRCLFFLSATPFYCGVFRQISSRFILHYCKNCMNYVDVYSPPLSVHKHCIFRSNSFWTFSLNSLNLFKTFDFCLRISTQLYIEKSSTNVLIYWKPLIDDCLNGLHRHLSSKLGLFIWQLVCLSILTSSAYNVISYFQLRKFFEYWLHYHL